MVMRSGTPSWAVTVTGASEPHPPARVANATRSSTTTVAARTGRACSRGVPVIGRKVAFRIRHDTQGQRPTLGLLHGFAQNRGCWGSLPEHLGDRYRVVAVDAPGHGDTSQTRADLDASADLAAAAIGRAVYLGYSMGGRVALHLALAHPELVDALVLISATAGLDTDTQRRARRADDERLAAHIEAIDVEQFLDEWLARPLFAGLDTSAQCRSERESNTAAGLASSLRLTGLGTQRPLWKNLPELTMPVLVVAGVNDPKFRDLARRLAQGIGSSATLAVIEEAGHTVHLEAPEAFHAVLDEWLDDSAPQT